MTAKIDPEKCCWKDGKCVGCCCGGDCEGCVEACPVEAIVRTDKVRIDAEKCINCGVCVDVCPHKAISLE
jgi:ferredoxin